MTEDDLRALISEIQHPQCEFDKVEVKAAVGGTPRVRESLSAFANRTGGGVLLFGLDERRDFAVVGVGNAQQIQEQIADLADHEMEPELRPTFTIQQIEGKTVVAVEVPEVPTHQKPCYYRPAGLQGGSYIRVGGTDRRMSDYEIFSFTSARTQPTDDQQPVREATMDDLDRTRLDAYLAQRRQARPGARYLDGPLEAVLERLHITGTVDGVMRPTLAGLLIFGLYPELFASQLVITFLQFYGTAPEEKGPRGERFLDNQKFEGPLPVMIEDAVNHIVANLRKSSIIDGIVRRDIPEYPVDALREAIINAVVHRDYSQFVRGSYIQVRLFADRLEIQSPGGLYGGVTEETLTTSQSTRNLEIVRLMEDLQYVENRGSGIRAMIDAMLAAKLEPPRFQDRRTAFVVTFFNSSLLNVETMTWLKQFATRDLNDAQRFALAYLRHHHAMTNRDYQVLNRVDYTDAHRDLRDLEVAGLVQARGTGSGATYMLAVSTTLPMEVPPQPRAEHDQDDAQRILVFVRTHGSINNEQCRDLLHVQESRATKLLREMVREGALRRIGAGPSTRYVLSES